MRQDRKFSWLTPPHLRFFVTIIVKTIIMPVRHFHHLKQVNTIATQLEARLKTLAAPFQQQPRKRRQLRFHANHI